jgi:hypothetical protein
MVRLLKVAFRKRSCQREAGLELKADSTGISVPALLAAHTREADRR